MSTAQAREAQEEEEEGKKEKEKERGKSLNLPFLVESASEERVAGRKRE